jgi:pyruvate dehydrogenase E2 component (dihydrolipoamide acetyltransferase)
VITEVLMPQMGLEVTEATVIEVLVQIGAAVDAEAPLLELETDKAITEVVAPRAGYVVAIDATPGQIVPVGRRLAVIGDRSDEEPPSSPDQQSPEAEKSTANPEPTRATKSAASSEPARLRAAPVARRAAERLGIELTGIRGTGPRGRITLRDVQTAAASQDATSAPNLDGFHGSEDTIPAGDGSVELFSTVRRTIARRMTESQLIPQYQLQRDVDASDVLSQKAALSAGAGARRPGLNDLLMQAIAEMMVRHPTLSMSFVDGPPQGSRRHEDVSIGLAVATERGLFVPVLRAVHRKGLRELAAERHDAVGAARAGRLTQDQVGGAAVTLSNLGSFGVDQFTAMLNPGESVIVAVGRTRERVVPQGRGLAVIPILTLTLSFDHRIVDGAVGAAAIADLADLLEGGMSWRP